MLEVPNRVKVGVGGEIDLDQRTLCLPHRGKVIVGRQGLPDLSGADVEGRHPVRLEPNPHREGPGAEDVRALYAFHRGQTRLNHPNQVIGDLVLLEEMRGEAQVGRRKLAVCRFNIDDWDLSLGRQIPPDLVYLGADLGKCLGRVVIQP